MRVKAAYTVAIPNHSACASQVMVSSDELRLLSGEEAGMPAYRFLAIIDVSVSMAAVALETYRSEDLFRVFSSDIDCFLVAPSPIMFDFHITERSTPFVDRWVPLTRSANFNNNRPMQFKVTFIPT